MCVCQWRSTVCIIIGTCYESHFHFYITLHSFILCIPLFIPLSIPLSFSHPFVVCSILVYRHTITQPLFSSHYRSKTSIAAKNEKEKSCLLCKNPALYFSLSSLPQLRQLTNSNSYHPDLIPKTARSLHEEAWNAYPYARTKFSCEFVPKFSLDIESRYEPDCGTQVWYTIIPATISP